MIYRCPEMPLVMESIIKPSVYVSGAIDYDHQDVVVMHSHSQESEAEAIWSSRAMGLSGAVVIWITPTVFSSQLLDVGCTLRGNKPTIIGVEKGMSMVKIIAVKSAMFRPDITVFESDAVQAKEQIDMWLNKLMGGERC